MLWSGPQAVVVTFHLSSNALRNSSKRGYVSLNTFTTEILSAYILSYGTYSISLNVPLIGHL